MIEVNLTAPILLRMAVITSGMEILAVRTGRAMAGVAIGTELLRGRVRGMTDVAVKFGVYTQQRKFGLRQVVVLDGTPHVVVVTTVALGAKARGVRVVGLVAAVAVLGNLVLVDTAAVATEAVDF